MSPEQNQPQNQPGQLQSQPDQPHQPVRSENTPPRPEQHHPDINSIYPSTPISDPKSPNNFSQQQQSDTTNGNGTITQNNSAPASPKWLLSAGDSAPQKTSGSDGLIVLEWLTYAFWGWTVFALSILTGLIVQSYVGKGGYIGGNNFTLYSLASVLVLLPVSFVCETLYVKRESSNKAGGSLAIMAIHAVLFALFGIGSVIAAAWSIVQMLTSSSSNNGATVALITSLIIAVYYAATFLRTLNFKAIPWLVKYYRFFMLITIGIMTILGIVGPMAKERAVRNDKLIESGLSSVSTAINKYASNKNQLPNNLSDLTLSGDAQKLVNDKLVEYKKESNTTSKDSSNNSLSSKYSSYSSYSVLTLRYQLCVTYKEKSSSPAYIEDIGNTYDTSDGYSSYLSTYGHKAGNVCYKLKTSYY